MNSAEGTLLTKILELQNSLTKESNLKEFVEIAEFQLTLINQFKRDVEQGRCNECGYDFTKKGSAGYYHDVEEYYKDDEPDIPLDIGHRNPNQLKD